MADSTTEEFFIVASQQGKHNPEDADTDCVEPKAIGNDTGPKGQVLAPFEGQIKPVCSVGFPRTQVALALLCSAPWPEPPISTACVLMPHSSFNR